MFSLGSDPEVFAIRSGYVVPAYFAMGGDVDWELPFGKAYPDGAAIEFSVEPTNDPAEMAHRIWANLREISERLRKEDLCISLVSNANVQRYISRLPEEFGTRASLQILGCQKDVRVYDWAPTTRRPDPKTYPFRTIGTHIHIELGEEHTKTWELIQIITAYLDATIGCASIYLMSEDTAAKQRMNLYGKSGTIRVKSKRGDGYDGLEYRTLCSAAVLSNEHNTELFFKAAQRAAEYATQLYTEKGLKACISDLGGVESIRYICGSIDNFYTTSCYSYACGMFDKLGIPFSFEPFTKNKAGEL